MRLALDPCRRAVGGEAQPVGTAEKCEALAVDELLDRELRSEPLCLGDLPRQPPPMGADEVRDPVRVV